MADAALQLPGCRSAWVLSLPGEMAFCPAGAVLPGRSCATKWKSYRRKRVGCAALEKVGSSLRCSSLNSPGPELQQRSRRCPHLVLR